MQKNQFLQENNPKLKFEDNGIFNFQRFMVYKVQKKL